MPPPIFSIRDHHHGVRHHHYHHHQQHQQDSHQLGTVSGGSPTQLQLVDREFQFRLFGWALLALWLGSIVYMTRGFWADWFRGFWTKRCSESSPSASSRCERQKTLLPLDWLSELDGVDDEENIELIRRQQCLKQEGESTEHIDIGDCIDDDDDDDEDSDEETELFLLPHRHHQHHNFNNGSKNNSQRTQFSRFETAGLL